MTIEERAREHAAGICGAGDIWAEVVKGIESALREQIEECAKVAEEAATDRDASARQIADKIRSLCPLA